jgi:hypothetical protein
MVSTVRPGRPANGTYCPFDQREKMRILAAIALLASTLGCFGGEASRVAMLTNTVAAVHEGLQSHDYTNTVARLFHLTNETEMAVAVVHLKRPKCLAMYEQLFAQLVSVTPSLDGEPPRAATFRCAAPIIVGAGSQDRYEKMEVMFLFDGSQWIFHDPSFERKLGRRITSKE